MIVTKRRSRAATILHGLGATVALPLLDAMIPADGCSQYAGETDPRLASSTIQTASFMTNGCRRARRDFELSPTLGRMQPFRDKLIVVTGLSMDQAEALGDGGGDHSRACGGYLNGVHVRNRIPSSRPGCRWTRLAARAFEREPALVTPAANGTRTASSARGRWLQLRVQQHDLVAHADVPLMAENNPRVVFERLFGASDSQTEGARGASASGRSILDQ